MKKQIKQRKFIKNPMTFSEDNSRRWIYLYIPKYKEQKQIAIDYAEYFNIPYLENEDSINFFINPFIEFWNLIQKQKISEISKKNFWREYLIENPELYLLYRDWGIPKNLSFEKGMQQLKKGQLENHLRGIHYLE